MDIRILVAEDETVFRDLVSDILKKEGFSPIEAADGREAIDLFFATPGIDLVILDVMMPHYNGWEVLQEIREHSDVPVIMLTALGNPQYEAQGLRQGADDYIAKPFSYEVFVARIHNILKKITKDRTAEITLGGITVCQTARRVYVHGTETELGRKEYDLLLYLIRNSGRTLSREQILSHVWGYDYPGEIRTIDTHIKTLRAKLGSCGDSIRTIRGSGYRFEVDAP